MFKFFYRPPEFFPRGKFLLKITILGDFWDRKATFLKLQWWNLAWECSRDTPSPRQNFVKSCKGIYPFWGKFIPIITIFGNILGRKPTFLKPQWWYLAWGCGLGTPSPHQIIPLLGKFIPKIWNFGEFELLQPTFHTSDVEIWTNLGNIRNLSSTQNFVKIAQGENRSRGLSVLHCLAEVMHIDF